MYCCTMENAYATIKLQVLPNLLTPASTRKKSAQFHFATRLLVRLTEVDLITHKELII
jgi:hypothetical protein